MLSVVFLLAVSAGTAIAVLVAMGRRDSWSVWPAVALITVLGGAGIFLWVQTTGWWRLIPAVVVLASGAALWRVRSDRAQV